jgi:hypothetical protein
MAVQVLRLRSRGQVLLTLAAVVVLVLYNHPLWVLEVMGPTAAVMEVLASALARQLPEQQTPEAAEAEVLAQKQAAPVKLLLSGDFNNGSFCRTRYKQRCFTRYCY